MSEAAVAKGAEQALQYTTFYLDKLFFGVETVKVQEVLRYQQMTPVPLAATVVKGLINLRGQIVPAVDLRRRLGLKERPAGELPQNVVVRSDEGAVSMLVDEIGDVIEVNDELYEPPPENVPEKVRDLIRGVYKLPGKLLMVLASEKALHFESEP